MKKVTINSATYWYNKRIGQLFYDYRMKKQCPVSIFNNYEYESFLKQIQTN